AAAPAAPELSPRPELSINNYKDALLGEVRKAQAVFYNAVLAQAQRVETGNDRITFIFASTQRTMKDMFEQKRPWLENLAQQVSGRKIAVTAAVGGPTVQPGATEPAPSEAAPAAASPAPAIKDRKSALRDQALADAGVQALLEVFPAEIRDVEEM